MRIIISLSLTLLLSTVYAENCVFMPESDCVNRLKIFIDREGSIYPPSNLYSFRQGLFFNPPKDGNDNTSKLNVYFKNDLVGLTTVCKGLGVTDNFDAMQNYLLKSYAERINKEVKEGKKIVFLIHGFNSPYEASLNSYDILKSKLSNRNDIAIVEVYWDGLTKNALRIWSNAQVNSIYAGLAMRKLLTKVDSNAKIMLLTHSLGASVATQALFNVSKWTNEFQKYVDCLSNVIPTPPQKHIILSMFAPAIPGVNTFDDLNRTVGNNTALCIKKIIVGYNQKDLALIKGIGIKENIGSTSLGCNSKDEIKKMQEVILSITPNITCKSFDLSKKPKPREHSIAEYVLAELFNSFLAEAFVN
jgi:hypothetical protein